MLQETMSRGQCGLGCPSHTSERGGEGDCVKEGGGGEGECESESKPKPRPKPNPSSTDVAERGVASIGVR